MKNFIIFFILLFSSTNLCAQLPLQLWDFAPTNTRMYFPEKLGKAQEFHIQTDYHFLRFNSHDLKFTQFRSVAPFEKKHKMEQLVDKVDLNLMTMYLEYNGEKFKVIRGEGTADYMGEWVEGGKFYQRRFIDGLRLEDGPLFEFGLEIASWADAFSFTLTYEESFLPEDEMKLYIEFDFPEEMYKVSKSSSNVVTVEGRHEMIWELYSDNSENLVRSNGTQVVIEGNLSHKSLSALFKVRHAFQRNDEVIVVVATDKNTPFDRLQAYRDIQKQATVVKLSGNMEPKFGMERTKLILHNPSDTEQMERFIFEKTDHVKDITGGALILRDKDGYPTGIPIQISKNWHNDYYTRYEGPWIRGYTILAIPPRQTVELELTRVTGFWGNLPAVSHSQLSLSSWGKKHPTSHQLWEETAVGAFGESICYEPYGGSTQSMITDVRPLFVQSTKENIPEPYKYNWTPNVGGGDFLRFYGLKGHLRKIKEIKVEYKRNCPNLSEVIYKGKTEDGEADYKLTTFLIRSNDYLRAYYHVELEVNETIDFNRLAIAQFGSETYAFSHENNFAYGNENGVFLDIENEREKEGYSLQNIDAPGAAPWVSMHNAENQLPGKYGTWANRGLVLREWKSIIDGKLIDPQFSTYVHFSKKINKNVTLVELNLPAHIRSLHKGDKIDAVIELCVLPNEADSYYGDNQVFKEFIKKEANTWKPMYREAYQNTLQVNLKKGKLVRRTPLMIEAENDEVVVDLSNGLGYVPITISGISNYKDFKAIITRNGDFINLREQEKFGNDYWQTDFDTESRTWQVTYSIPMDVKIEP
ncbi:hypothetical protein HHU12_31665 [Flammeovirga aprica JL-4]|uniref:Uncharacterized protein n=2 Tax=Flammeovirga aprica TaxID=29528 RepID=A0A7X9S1G2_9BACT|nr:hypothetical protein [Flammeovirga aprica JL-4]